MSHTARRLAALVVGLSAVAGAARGQSADDAKAVRAKYDAERAAAVKGNFPPDALARADEAAKRGERALAAGEDRTAARFFRDARWLVPYLPANLPPHVGRVLGETRLRHADWVNDLAYSPDSTLLASASRDGTVKVWDLGNGREVATYRGHAEAGDPSKDANVLKATGVAFSPDGKTVASVGGTQVHLWEPATGKRLKLLAKLDGTDKPLKAVAFHPEGKLIAVGGDDQRVRVYEVETGKAVFTSPTPLPGRVEGLAYNPTGKLLAASCSDGTLAVYAPGAANPLALSVQCTDGGSAHGVAFTADGSGLLTAGEDRKLRLTAGPKADGNTAGNTATRLREYLGHTDKVFALAISSDRSLVVSGGRDRSVRVWEVDSGKQVRTFQGHAADVISVAVRPDGRQVASASADGNIRLWDLSTVDDHKAMTAATDSLWAVAVSPDGKRAAAAGADKVIRVFDPLTGKVETELKGSTAPVTTLAFFPDSNRLASAGGDRVVRVWDVAAGKVLKELAGHESVIQSVAVADGGKLVVSGAADRTVRGWSPGSDKPLWTWTGRSIVCAVAARPDGKQVAAGLADGGLVLLDTSAAPKEIASQTAHAAGTSGVAFDAAGARLATGGGDGSVRVWTVGEGGALAPFAKFEGQIKPGSSSGFAPVSAVSFSPDARHVASAGADGVVRVWDVQTRGEVRGLRGHTDWVTAVAFGPDGRQVVSAGVDKAARAFELSQQDTAPPPGHSAAVRAVAVSPDGTLVATAAKDSTIKVWDRATGREVTTLIGTGADTVYAITFLGNDALAAGGEVNNSTGRVQFWNIKPGKLTKAVVTGRVWGLVGAADGSKAGAWALRPTGLGDKANHAFEVYDPAGALVRTLSDKGRDVKCVSFSADVAWAVAGDDQGAIRIWDLAKNDRVGGDWPLFVQGVLDLGVTPDKSRLVAVDEQGLIKVGDVAKRETLGSGSHKGGLNGLVISPKGDTFLSIGADGEVKCWSLTDVKEVRSWKLPTIVWGAAYTPDGKQVVTANGDGTASVLELP